VASTEQQSTGVPASVDDRVCWSTVAGLALLHAGAIAGVAWIVFHPSTATLVLAMSLYAVCGLAITAGYHRLFAHRTYRASAIVRWLMLAFGAATFQNSAVAWSADHRAHHADTDGDGDPHAITRGIWFAHMGWLFHRRVASSDVSTLRDLWAGKKIARRNGRSMDLFINAACRLRLQSCLHQGVQESGFANRRSGVPSARSGAVSFDVVFRQSQDAAIDLHRQAMC